MHIQSGARVCAAFGFAVLGACASGGEEAQLEPAGDVEVRVSAVARGSSVVEYTITNHSREVVELRPWQTLALEHADSLLDVRQGGTPLKYLGPDQPRAGASIETPMRWLLEPAQTLSARLDVKRFYDLPRGGAIEVGARALPAGMLAQTELTVAVAPAVQLLIEADVASDSRVAVHAQAITLGETCNPQDAFAIWLSHRSAYQNVLNADRAFQNDAFSSELFHWFGASSDRRRIASVFATVTGYLNREDHGPPNPETHYECVSTCPPDWVARSTVIPYYVQLCDDFWSYSDWPAALAHEFTHWAGTDDIAYGRPDCEALVRDDPGQAVINADNYRYYIDEFR